MTAPEAFRIGDTVNEISKRRPSLATRDRFEVLDPLATTQAFQQGRLFTLPLRRNQPHDRLTNDLLRRISKETFSTRVPGFDDSFQRLADDGVVRRRDDGSQPGLRYQVALALHEVVANLVLPLARPQRRADGADQRGDPRRSLQDGHVSQHVDRPDHRGRVGPRAAR